MLMVAKIKTNVQNTIALDRSHNCSDYPDTGMTAEAHKLYQMKWQARLQCLKLSARQKLTAGSDYRSLDHAKQHTQHSHMYVG